MLLGEISYGKEVKIRISSIWWIGGITCKQERRWIEHQESEDPKQKPDDEVVREVCIPRRSSSMEGGD